VIGTIGGSPFPATLYVEADAELSTAFPVRAHQKTPAFERAFEAIAVSK